jgi:hypothetical protein
MNTQTHKPGEIGSELSRTMGISSNTSYTSTQQERRHQWVYWDATNVAMKHIAQNANLKIICKTGSSKNNK